MKRSTIWLIVGLLIIGAFFYYRYRVAPSIDIPEITIIDENGDRVLLSTKHNGPMLLNFYASWCGPCMNEMPDLQRASLMNEAVTIIGLTDDTPEKIAKVRDHFGITFPIYQLDKSLNDYGVYTIPTTFIYGPDNGLLLDHIGPYNWANPKILSRAAEGSEIELKQVD
jgi:thiol-disulfide isomerase/thioredoxin